MASAGVKNAARELIVRDLEGKTVSIPLDRDRIGLGRSSVNELCYPDDAGLSRQHLAIIRTGEEWRVDDLGSKNGTVVNGRRIEKSAPFNPGDRISAGHLTIEFAEPGAATNTVVFTDQDAFSTTATTVVANLENLVGSRGEDLNKTHLMS